MRVYYIDTVFRSPSDFNQAQPEGAFLIKIVDLVKTVIGVINNYS